MNDRINYSQAIELAASREWPAGTQTQMRIDNLFADCDAADTRPLALLIERLEKPVKGKPISTAEKFDLRIIDGGEGITGK